MTDTTGVGFRSERGPILIALMMTTGLVAIDSTILATAVPSIVEDLGGVAWSMPALIAARAIQGLGAGAVAPMAITIAGDIYTVTERAKTQGYLASVWAVSSVVGPTLGGVFFRVHDLALDLLSSTCRCASSPAG